jgi:ataxia telangiectasia mutated family protein
MRAPQEIRATFDRAYNMMKASKLTPVEQARVCHEYALFADGHYQALSKSPELERLRINRDRTLSVLQQIESTTKSSKSKSASARTDESRRQDVMEDEKALKELEVELTSFAKIAMKMFATSLAASDEFDDAITRLCSLWLEHDYSEEVNKAFANPLLAIPTYKFLFLGPQLAARIYKPKQTAQFNVCLNKLVLRMCTDHPFHILYQLITVAQGSDNPNSGPSSSKSRRTSDISMTEGRMPAAIEILAALQSPDSSSSLARDAAQQMMRFTNAAVPWCHHQDSDKKSARYDYQMAKSTPLLGIINMKIPPPSVAPPVDLTRRYSSIATIQRYRTHYRVLGGIHRPKRMTCIDSSGHEHYELVSLDRAWQRTNELILAVQG